MTDPTVIDNPWQGLRRFTAARIALGRAGVSQPTASQLDFQLAHAQARDAVHQALDVAALRRGLAKLQLTDIALHSAAGSRQVYLQRPDLGRRLDPAARAALQAQHGGASGCDLAIVVADGLSALAIERNALPFLRALLPRVQQEGWTLAPVVIVEQGRVAVGDEAGEVLGARAVLVLIGERPGLSSPDSMGLYLTWAPRVGLTDESRNCVSNVRAAGLGHEAAAAKLHYLLAQACRRGLTGVALKDESADEGLAPASADGGFLL
ncbi:ethanolamine ammonia-lyase subunit EutC [Herbaspirillum sp. SJZ107]|uniref:ethanolamine ammonia-lyase subunit EutC n=1 Tax=Herbaspirillum sp. SJZ107 TaxID=2572881 RepID=UPI00115015FB|nr:ethanolamine ammonia-lyase subunit EutC [Herbaspirillum sp. SJZ107]TQK02654.1 ethanolamine ammonia-lyase light chain [Herbaspirillum sp. SJZ107]